MPNAVTKQVELDSISKTFANGNVALENVTISACSGEIIALLGENGAGKTTLMNILAGSFQPTSGSLRINGKPHSFGNPLDAKGCGIGMLQQHFALVRALTVGENLALGGRGQLSPYSPKRWERYLVEKAEEHGLDIRPSEPVWKLSMGERQRVEIFRLILDDSQVLILDEPTSVLSPREADSLFAKLTQFAELGRIVFLVTHNIEHARRVANRVAVLRRGRLVNDSLVTENSDEALMKQMFGAAIPKLNRPDRTNTSTGAEPVLRLTNVSVQPQVSRDGLLNVSLEIESGEILGVAGISGNGQDELVSAVVGSQPFEGAIEFNPSARSTSSGLAYITADRQGEGLATSLSIEDNLVLRNYQSSPFSRYGVLNRREVRAFADTKISELDIRPDIPSQKTGEMSGGNMQKVLLARELDQQPALIVAVNPTSGLDLATARFVLAKLMEHARLGAAVMLVSEDLDELLKLSDRIVVLHEGAITLVGSLESITKDEIGAAMCPIESAGKPITDTATSLVEAGSSYAE